MEGLTQRVFLAIDPVPWKDALSQWQVFLQQKCRAYTTQCTWSKKISLHVTLLFLGELTISEVIRLKDALEQFRCDEVIQLKVREIGLLNNHHIVVMLEEDNLIKLHQALFQFVYDLGLINKIERKFIPHITMGKIKNQAISETLMAEFKQIDTRQCQAVKIQQFALYQSFTGSHYEILKQYLL